MSKNPNDINLNPISLKPNDQIQTILLLLMTGFGVYLCYEIALLFLPALVWALTLAILFTPFQIWLELKLKRHSLASFVAVVAISLIGIAPAIMVGQ